MDGEQIKQNLDGLSKIDSITEFLNIAIYWVAIIFIVLFVGYMFSSLNCYLNRKKKGNSSDNDDFLDD